MCMHKRIPCLYSWINLLCFVKWERKFRKTTANKPLLQIQISLGKWLESSTPGLISLKTYPASHLLRSLTAPPFSPLHHPHHCLNSYFCLFSSPLWLWGPFTLLLNNPSVFYHCPQVATFYLCCEVSVHHLVTSWVSLPFPPSSSGSHVNIYSVFRTCQVAFDASLAWNRLSSSLFYPHARTHKHTHSLSLSPLFILSLRFALMSASLDSLLWPCCCPDLLQTQIHCAVWWLLVLLNCELLQGKDCPLWFNLYSQPRSMLGTALGSIGKLFLFSVDAILACNDGNSWEIRWDSLFFSSCLRKFSRSYYNISEPPLWSSDQE